VRVRRSQSPLAILRAKDLDSRERRVSNEVHQPEARAARGK